MVLYDDKPLTIVYSKVTVIICYTHVHKVPYPSNEGEASINVETHMSKNTWR